MDYSSGHVAVVGGAGGGDGVGDEGDGGGAHIVGDALHLAGRNADHEGLDEKRARGGGEEQSEEQDERRCHFSALPVGSARSGV